jgi:hypothetical protein
MAMVHQREPGKTAETDNLLPGKMFEVMTGAMEAFWSNQHRILTLYGDFASHWVERRQQAAQTGLDAMREMLASNGQPARLPEIANAWLRGSFERVSADMQKYRECCSAIAAALQVAPAQGGKPARH